MHFAFPIEERHVFVGPDIVLLLLPLPLPPPPPLQQAVR
jgi:hypothetical protein